MSSDRETRTSPLQSLGVEEVKVKGALVGAGGTVNYEITSHDLVTT